MAGAFGFIASAATAANRGGGYSTVIDRTTHFKDSAAFDKRLTVQEMTFTDKEHEQEALKSGDLSHADLGDVHCDTLTLRSSTSLVDKPWHRVQVTAPDGSKSHLGFLTRVTMPAHHSEGMHTGGLVISHRGQRQGIFADGVTHFDGFDRRRNYVVNPDKSAAYTERGFAGYREARAETRPDGSIVIRSASDAALLATIKPLLKQSYYVTAEMTGTDKKYETANDLNRNR